MAEAGSRDAEGLSNKMLEYVLYFTLHLWKIASGRKDPRMKKKNLDKGVKHFMEGFIHQIK